MNTELLERIADHIEAVPESFDLSQWAWVADEHELCDTIGCVAGWAVMLEDPEMRQEIVKNPWKFEIFPFEATAARLLELNDSDAITLFASNRWWGWQMRAAGFEPKEGHAFIEDDWIDLDGVPSKAAAEILRALAAGHISLNGNWGDSG